jgi:cell division protein ZapB
MSMNEMELKHLERRVDEILQRLASLKSENQALRESQAALLSERAKLIEKNELARSRVEAMISRLKSMEQES